MQVFHTDSHLPHIVRQILSHPLGQSRHQDLITPGYLFVHLSDQIINLPFYRTDKNLRI